jgi:hypothetical protein
MLFLEEQEEALRLLTIEQNNDLTFSVTKNEGKQRAKRKMRENTRRDKQTRDKNLQENYGRIKYIEE